MAKLTEIATLTAQLYNAHCHLWNEVPIAYNDIGSEVSNDIAETWSIKSASLLLDFLSLEEATVAFRDHYELHGVGAGPWDKFIDSLAEKLADRELGLENE
jgi:hypothetical protein